MKPHGMSDVTAVGPGWGPMTPARACVNCVLSVLSLLNVNVVLTCLLTVVNIRVNIQC